ncbi:MAG: Ig-like domain-containing protein [Deltaproteobacteria bacterium]|nr:Ig-like domain-containing protein [Deltaproteobacteria bacterium]
MKIKNSARLLINAVVAIALCGFVLSCGGGGDSDSGGASGQSGTITLSVDTTTLPADGSSSANITATILDSAGNPVRHYTEVVFKTNLGHFRNGGATYTMQTQPPLDAEGFPNPDAAPTGIAEAALIAATQAGTARVTVTSNGVTQAVDIEMTGGLVSGISLSTSSASVSTDNSDSTTITATVLDANNAALKDTTISLAASTGTLSAPSVVTDENGQATVTFSCGNLDSSNRTATINATSGSASKQISIRITGTTLDLATDYQNLEVTNSVISTQIDNAKAILTISAKDAGDNRISNALITVSVDPSSTGDVAFSSSSGYTDSSGELKVEVFGKSKGTVIVKVEGLGATATQSYSVGLAGEVFSIISPTEDPYSLAKGASVSIVVQAPTQSQVIFATTCGAWDGGTSAVVTKSVTSGQAAAALSSTEACNATVQVYDAADPNTSDSMKVNIFPPADSAARIDLQANSYVVALSTGGILNSVVLEATVRDDTFQIVPNVAVSFSISDSTGGGEYVSPPLAYTLSGSGKAEATFTSGSVSSGARGVTVTATVVGKETVTDSVSIVIGGTAGSVVIGQSTLIESTEDGTAYMLPMTAQVVDSNGNPVPGARISLQLWPAYYNTGIWVPQRIGPSECIPEISNTYPNEDDTFPGTNFYRNLILDPGEDANGDGQLTPSSSAAGGVPAEVVADENGLAAFELVYPKSQAAWIVAEITGSTLVLGSETRSTTEFTLPYLIDPDSFNCLLPDSPYNNSQPTVEIALTATPEEVYPDGGISTSSIRAQVTQLGNPVADGTPVSFAIISGIGSLGPSGIIYEFTATTVAGQASATYYSGDRPGDVTIRAILADGTSATVDLKLTRGAGEPFTIDLTLTPAELSADGGNSQSYVRANVTDSDDFPVFDGTLITFAILSGSGTFGAAFPGGTNEVSALTTAGIASAIYYSGSITTETEKVMIRAQAENGSFAEKELTLVEVIGSMTLTASPITIPPDNTSTSAITATIKDTAGQPVPKGTSVTFTTNLGTFENDSDTFTVPTPNETGAVTVSLKSDKEGPAYVTASATIGTNTVTQSVYISIGVTYSITLWTDKTNIESDGSDKATITATLVDNTGTPVDLVTVNFSTDTGTLNPAAGAVQTDADGKAQIELTVAGGGTGTAVVTAAYQDANNTIAINYD